MASCHSTLYDYPASNAQMISAVEHEV